MNKNKKLGTTLNHADFMHVIDPSEEDNIVTKKVCALKEAMNVPHEKEVIEAMEKEINNHAERKHW